MCRGGAAHLEAAGWRDLRHTKHALFKGQEHLDQMFVSSGHHLADDVLSEHTACVYRARTLSIAVLESKVCPGHHVFLPGLHVLLLSLCFSCICWHLPPCLASLPPHFVNRVCAGESSFQCITVSQQYAGGV